jgi:hypothetical protein
MIKSIGDIYKICGLIIVKTTQKIISVRFGLSNAFFEPPNYAFAL